ncbi:unnamed protein product [Closterium sp. NIES-65]|nr:unnamed protein product [Closterium sp. NIES-65]
MCHLGPRDIASLAMSCRRFRQLAVSQDVWQRACQHVWGAEATAAVQAQATVGWKTEEEEAAEEVVRRGRYAWHGKMAARPRRGFRAPRRWGHTLSCVNGSGLVVFGGCGREGLLNDAFLLDLDDKQPKWREVVVGEDAGSSSGAGAGDGGTGGEGRGSARGNAVLGDGLVLRSGGDARAAAEAAEDGEGVGSKLVVSGGCTASGRLLSDTFLLDLAHNPPSWKEIRVAWAPPARLGHTLSALGGRKVLMFGGLATSGALRLRSNDAFTIDLADEHPNWQTVYLLDPGEEKPRWRELAFPGQQPRIAWGHSTCVVGGTKAVVLGGQTGKEWVLNELHELSLLSAAAMTPPARVLRDEDGGEAGGGARQEGNAEDGGGGEMRRLEGSGEEGRAGEGARVEEGAGEEGVVVAQGHVASASNPG